MKRLLKKLFSVACCLMISQSLILPVKAADTIAWENKLIGGSSILYYVDSGCMSYSSVIYSAEVEMEIPANTSLTNNIKMSRTSIKSSSQMDIYKINQSYTTAVARTSCYLPNSSQPMYVYQKDQYDWYWAKIEINAPLFDDYSYSKQKVIVVHEMLHAYGLRDLYDDSNYWSIMYNNVFGTATGMTVDANNVLRDKY